MHPRKDARASSHLWKSIAASVLLAGTMMGCQQTSPAVRNAVVYYYSGDYLAAENSMRPEIQKKSEDFVLNNCRFGSCAIAAGDLPAAENAFMAAYEVINGVKTNDGGRTLGATLVFEGVKVWKGEPFERAMAHYYLGLTNLMKTPPDYDNARAAFKNSLFKLREYADASKKGSESDQYQALESNFALGYFGVGYCYLRSGQPDQAEVNFNQALKLQPGLRPMIDAVKNPQTNGLLFVDAGQGPQRAAKGWYNEESAFGPTPIEAGAIPQLQVYVDSKVASAPVQYYLVDTLAMAQDQRWQDIDTIRKTKAVIGTGAMAAGTGLLAYGAEERNTGLALAGLGVALAGAAIAASSQADVRYWEMLPRTVYVVPVALPPGPHSFLVNVNGTITQPFTLTLKAPGQGDAIQYVRLGLTGPAPLQYYQQR